VPSAFTLLKAEFGYTGNRTQVWESARKTAEKEVLLEYLDN
jgi:hypothetical protein